MYKLREVKYEDYESIKLLTYNKEENIHLHENISYMDKVFFDRMLVDETVRWYAVEKDAQIRAFVLFHLDVSTKEIHIDRFTIDGTYKNKGLDEHLYSKVERLAEKKSFTKIKTEISTTELDVYDFFESKGWIKAENGSYVLTMKK
ncbi:GNAT family N-acetyltransferase [Virgibacillus litoralis]|uniref:Ribosomal protein S18 acetylase RimI-like enzyme n=1 Tax=Virgibacillus litoralis TaxID=578221 RepID=A0ABS4HCB3_9BACI|nr:GNAT family N-acetyltransferase [Virgibacillus litoralis]MBP1948503.1 ribosomal protein S18 acetylase RimI-like enzyme [Virgibacillus litoralis]